MIVDSLLNTVLTFCNLWLKNIDFTLYHGHTDCIKHVKKKNSTIYLSPHGKVWGNWKVRTKSIS